MLWIAKYYFDECPSWTWYYPYDHAPFISDLTEHFKRSEVNETIFEKGEALRPFEQLLCVIPPQFAYLLPKTIRYLLYKNNSPLIHLYPYDFELDMLYKTQYWQSIPFLPDIDIKLVKETYEKQKIDKEDMDRNSLKKNYVYN